MEMLKNVKSTKTLNTQGCCFLCLEFKDNDKTKQTSDGKVRQSIQSLLRHLQITAQSVNGSASGSFNGECIRADFCKSCAKIISRFSILFYRLEKVQMEMNYLLRRINQCIFQSSNNSKLVQNYSKRMTSDMQALAQLAFVDNLRKQLFKKSFNKQANFPHMQIILTRTLPQEETVPIKKKMRDPTNTVKSEDDDDQFISNGHQDFLSDSPSNSSMSPDSSEHPEAEVKFRLIPSELPVQDRNEDMSIKLPIGCKNTNKKGSHFCARDKTTGVYKCRKCDKSAKCSDTIREHFKAVHLKQRYKCDLCKLSVFSYSSSLANHKRICRQTLQQRLSRKNKSASFKFVCTECGNKFSTKEILSKHQIGVHQNNPKLLCDLCDKKFKLNEHLKEHKQFVHFGKKVHCKFCKKMFSSRGGHYLHKKLCTKVILKSENK